MLLVAYRDPSDRASGALPDVENTSRFLVSGAYIVDYDPSAPVKLELMISDERRWNGNIHYHPVIPGLSWRRHLLFRYSLVWTRHQ